MIKVRDLKSTHEGAELVGRVALPSTPGPHPAVMVMYSAMGLTNFVVERITRLAELGYAAIATDMYGGGIGFAADDNDAAGPCFTHFINNPVLLRTRVAHWFEHIKQLPEKMNKAGADCQLTLFSHACHSFTDPAANKGGTRGIAYEPRRSNYPGMEC